MSSSQHGAELLNEINVIEEAETPVLQSNANGENVQPAGVSGTNNGASGKALGEVRAFGRVGKRLAEEINKKRSSLNLEGKYLELNADDLREAYKRHSSPKEKGDIPLTENDFVNIPEYIDEFDYVLGVNEYNGKIEIHLATETEDGYVKILTVSSKERDSLQVSKIIGVSKAKFNEKYGKKIERDTGSLRGLSETSENSNPSTTAQLTAGTLSNDIIGEKPPGVKNIISDSGQNYTTNIQSDGRHHTTKAEQERIKRVCEALGVKMKFVHITKQLMAEYGYTFADGTLPDGFYDKETNTLYIGYTGIDPVKFVLKHELTHFGEGTAQYTKFVEAVKSSNAFKNWLADITKSDVNNISVAAMEGKARQMYIDARANLGTEFGVMDAQAEMIADFVGDMLFNNNADALDRMISSLEVKERNAFLQYILDFLSHLKKKLAGEKDLAFEISRLEDHYNRMLSEAVQTKKAAPKGDGIRFSFEGYAEDGKGKYKSNFPQGTPKKAKGERILKYIQEVWSKKPIRLKINEDGMTRYIEAKFDPTYDETKHIFNDATKLMGGNRHGTSSEQRVTLDLADDYYQIASESSYNYSKDEIGKQNPAHEDVKKWHYFVNDIYFAEYDSEEYTPYRVTINVKEKSDGEYVYSFSAEKQRESDTQRTLHAVVNDGNNPDANVELSNNKLTQNKPIVKNNISDSGANNSNNGLKFTISRALDEEKIKRAEEMERKLKGAYDGNEFKKQKHRLFRKGWAVFLYFVCNFV